MENQSNSNTKVLKKLKVDSFAFSDSKTIKALCVVGENLSHPGNYSTRHINVHELTSFLKRKGIRTNYNLETISPLLVADLAYFLNEKEGRTADMDELKLDSQALRHREENPITKLINQRP